MLLLKLMGVLPLISWKARLGSWLIGNQPFKQKGVRSEEGFLFNNVLATWRKSIHLNYGTESHLFKEFSK